MFTAMSVSERTANGKTITTTEKFTLKQDGIEEFHGGISLGKADVKMRTTLKATDKDKAEELAVKWEKGLKGAGLKNLQKEAELDKPLEPLVNALKSVHITTKGDGVLVEAQGAPEAVVAAGRAFFMVRRAPARDPEPRPDQIGPISPNGANVSQAIPLRQTRTLAESR
jgi:hypothetical protein